MRKFKLNQLLIDYNDQTDVYITNKKKTNTLNMELKGTGKLEGMSSLNLYVQLNDAA